MEIWIKKQNRFYKEPRMENERILWDLTRVMESQRHLLYEATRKQSKCGWWRSWPAEKGKWSLNVDRCWPNKRMRDTELASITFYLASSSLCMQINDFNLWLRVILVRVWAGRSLCTSRSKDVRLSLSVGLFGLLLCSHMWWLGEGYLMVILTLGVRLSFP